LRAAQIGQCCADNALVRGQHHRERTCPRLVIGGIVDREAHGNPCIVDDDIERAELRCGIGDDGLDRSAVGDVERPGFCDPTAFRDLAGYSVRTVAIEIRHRDFRAFIGEDMRGGAAHAARCPRDECGQSLDRPAELLDIGHPKLAC
jgi:hypothetical protein